MTINHDAPAPWFFHAHFRRSVMNEKDFTARVRQLVADYTNKHLDVTDKKRILPNAVFIVWQCKTLQNSKALASTVLCDGMYYEIPTTAIKSSSTWMLTKSLRTAVFKPDLLSPSSKHCAKNARCFFHAHFARMTVAWAPSQQAVHTPPQTATNEKIHPPASLRKGGFF